MSPLALSIVVILSTGCASTGNNIDTLQADLEKRQAALDAREQSLNTQEENLKLQGQETTQVKRENAAEYNLAQSDLLPPNATKGQCFARVWQDATYRTNEEAVLVNASYETIEVTPAEYKIVSKQVEVKPESSKLVSKPAVYGNEETSTLVRDEKISWRATTSSKSDLISNEVIDFAKSHSTDDISAATPGMCYHEHRKPSSLTEETEEVMVSEAYDVVTTVPAEYEMVSKTIVVKEASTEIIDVPATYKTVEQKILVKPASTVWKKGTGPIQRIDSATGEIMCLVEVPAEYKTLQTREIDTPATTKTVEIPEVTKVVQVRKEVTAAQEVRKTIPAEYKTVTKTTPVDGELVWHEIHDLTMNKESRTGRQICLVKEPAVYKTTTKRVVKVPASTEKVVIPAEFETIEVKEVVKAASEKRTTIPAEYNIVESQELVESGRMEWRSILCETNMTNDRITDIQTALKDKGYNPGPIDGVVGTETMKAMNEFQKDNNLPIDKYLNVESIRALGVSEK